MRVTGIILKTIAALAGIVIVLLVVAGMALNSHSVQQKLLRIATDMLTDKLQTRVAIDSIHVGFLTQDIYLYGLQVDDRQQRHMLQLQELSLDVKLLKLLSNEVSISEATVKGLSAELHKDSTDSVANYQFVLDAFKKEKKPDDKQQAEKAEMEKKQLVLDLSSLTIEGVDLTLNDKHITLRRVITHLGKDSNRNGELSGIAYDFIQHTKKGDVPTRLQLGLVRYNEQQGHHLAEIDSLQYITDNGLPRKNADKPKRGFFDIGHLNVTAHLKLDIDHIAQDTLHATLLEATAADPMTGIDIRQLACGIGASKQSIHLTDCVIRQCDTELRFDQGSIQLPSKQKNTPLAYSTSTIKGNVILRDISRTFAPVLGNFTMPLNLSVRMSGDNNHMEFRDVVVSSPDQQLKVTASGYINELKDKHNLKVHFDVHSMYAKGGSKERIINQFAVKKFMMKQLHALGTLRYKGSFNVLWKQEEFTGNVQTQLGSLSFYFTLDENNKYLTGKASTNDLQLGQVMDMKDIGKIAANANFKFDISKPRTAQMRKRLGGKLPIGEVTAHVTEASYKFIKTRNVDVHIASNGAVAEGELNAPGSFADLSCDFSFTNTNEMKKTKIKPRIKLNFLRSKKTTQKQKK